MKLMNMTKMSKSYGIRSRYRIEESIRYKMGLVKPRGIENIFSKIITENFPYLERYLNARDV